MPLFDCEHRIGAIFDTKQAISTDSNDIPVFSTGELYSCVARTVQHNLPCEIRYMRNHDEAKPLIMQAVAMPDRLAKNLILHIRQNGGTLSKKRRSEEFQSLRDDEASLIESIARETFEEFSQPSQTSRS